MQNQDVATWFQCPNEFCKTINPASEKFCQQCQTPIVKRYLWAVGEGIENYQIGELVGKRYLQTNQRIFLDTKPGLPPEMPVVDIAESVQRYLRLIAYRLHIPQVYGYLPQNTRTNNIILLEQAAIYPDGVALAGQLMPELTSVWQNASSLRQLHWLWQIAQLWQPLRSEGVASTLLLPQLWRVDGSIIRLLELQSDLTWKTTPKLSHLGEVWSSQLIAQAKPNIAEFLSQLCASLVANRVSSADGLVELLEHGISEIERQPTRVVISTQTDTGPSRDRNEDACYPNSGTTMAMPPASSAFTIVCDGIGGHEGGSVASNLAIETIQQQIQQLQLNQPLDAATLTTSLERTILVANEKISRCNDRERRSGRQRMGTTLVMAIIRDRDITIAHVGDSRAYLITRSGCYQLTLDDDVAAREVRLGYTLYRLALQQPSSGSLVQALGMTALPSSLHPNVGRFILDEDCVFLLCSDGLSDFDRVEQYWTTEILPILESKVDITTAVKRLVHLGNTKNGHDNVTVSLIHCQVTVAEPASVVGAALLQHKPEAPTNVKQIEGGKTNVNAGNSESTPVPTKILRPQSKRRSLLPIIMGSILVLGVGSSIAAYLFLPEILRQINSNQNSNRLPPQLPTLNSELAPSPDKDLLTATIGVNSLLQNKNPILLPPQNAIATSATTPVAPPSQTQKTPAMATTNSMTPLQLPTNTILRVVGKQASRQQSDLLKLKIVCLPASNAQLQQQPASRLQPGQELLISQQQLRRAVSQIPSLPNGKCPTASK